MASTRLILGLSAALALAASSALAQSPAQKASTLNDQGKALMSAKKYADAELKFRAAIVLSPEGRFYLNLCMSLYQTGKLGEAHTACRAVKDHGASKDQIGQAQTIIEKFIEPRMREAGIDPDSIGKPDTGNPDTGNPDTGNPDTGNPDTGNPDTGNPDTGNPDTGNPDTGNPDTGNPDTGNTGNTGNTGGNFTVAPPPSLFDQVAANPKHEYTWSIGAQVLGMKASVGAKEDWDPGAAGLRILGDYALSARRGIGAQGYLTLFNLGGKDGGAFMNENLTIVDFGLSVYKEVCRGRACVKPLAGVQVALLSVSQDGADSAQFSAIGARAELGFEYALGKRYENVLTAAVGLDLYGPGQANGDEFAAPDPAAFGLDKSSANLYFGLGFTRRFNSPLGSQPLFQVQ